MIQSRYFFLAAVGVVVLALLVLLTSAEKETPKTDAVLDSEVVFTTPQEYTVSSSQEDENLMERAKFIEKMVQAKGRSNGISIWISMGGDDHRTRYIKEFH